MENIIESHVTVKTSPTSGNGLFATKNIAAGELVLMVRRPLVGVLDLARIDDTCSNCFMWSIGSIEGGLSQDKPAVNTCAGCKKVKYCSKRCQSQAWKREHKKSCKILKDLPPLPGAVRVALELNVLMNADTVSDETKQGVLRMESRDATTPTEEAAQGDTKEDAFDILDQAAKDIIARQNADEKVIDHAFVGKIYRNSLTLVTPTFDPLGLAFDPLLCTANHSCNPNTAIVMDGPQISMRSLVPVPQGSEIFITYIDNTNPFHIRQSDLLDRYSFTCACSKCVLGPTQREDEWLQPSSHLSVKINPASSSQSCFIDKDTPEGHRISDIESNLFKDVEAARRTQSPSSAIAMLSSVLQTCKHGSDGVVYPLTRQPYAAARNELFANLLAAGDAGAALRNQIKVFFDIDPILYAQEWHPVRVVHMFGLARVVLWLYGAREHEVTKGLHGMGFDFVVVVWKLLSKLEGLVGKSHGEGGRFAVLVKGLVEEVRREVGEHARLLESDPQGMWGVFRKLGDSVEI